MNRAERQQRIIELRAELKRLEAEDAADDSAIQDLRKDCAEMKANGQLLDAIKHYRNKAGVSLVEAKDIVTNL